MTARIPSHVPGRWRGPRLVAAALAVLTLGGFARAEDATQDHLKAARDARRAGNEAEAERHLKAASEAVALERKLLAAQRGDLDGVAKELIAAVQKDHPDSVLILEALARGFRESCRFPEAYRCLNEWLRRKPDDPEALYRLGRLTEETSRGDDNGWSKGPGGAALKYYRRAVEADPNHDAARLRLAEGLLEERNAPEAQGQFERLRQRRPKDPAPLLGLARCAVLMGRTAEGTKLLDRYLADHPRDARALLERGKVALQEDRPAQAEKWLRQAAAVAPADPEVAYVLAVCLRRAGKEDEANAALAGYRKMQEDVKRLQRCIKSAGGAPKDPAPRAEAGALLLRLGEEQEALRWLRSALRADPGNKSAHRALADYYQRKGDRERAEKHRRLAQ